MFGALSLLENDRGFVINRGKIEKEEHLPVKLLKDPKARFIPSENGL